MMDDSQTGHIKLEILKKNGYLQRTGDGSAMYNPDYKLLIIHALRYRIKESDLEYTDQGIEVLKNIMDELCSYVNYLYKYSNFDVYRKDPWVKEKFLEVYPLYQSHIPNIETFGECGILVVDRSKACFPLILYKPKDKNDKDRRKAFRATCYSIKNKIEELAPILFDHKRTWNEIKKEALEITRYSKFNNEAA